MYPTKMKSELSSMPQLRQVNLFYRLMWKVIAIKGLILVKYSEWFTSALCGGRVEPLRNELSLSSFGVSTSTPLSGLLVKWN